MAEDDEVKETFRERFRRHGDAGERAAGRVLRAGKRGKDTVAWVAAGRGRYNARHVLTAELLAGIGLVAIRAVADYEPQADGTMKGKIGHPKGQYGPLPTLAGLLVVFFLLSFLAARGGTRAKVAVIAGGFIDLVLAMKSDTEFQKVAATFSTFGKAKPPAGNWQTSGTQAGSALSGGITIGSSNGSSNNGQITKPKNGKCPPGHHYDKQLKRCFPDINKHIYT